MDSQNERQCRKAKHHKENDDPINCFGQLPYDVAFNILSRLPFISQVQLSLSWQSPDSLFRNPNFVNMHLSRSPMNERECLILHSDFPLQNQLHFLLFSDRKVRKINIPLAAMSMCEFSIIGSSNGLLCLINTLFPESIYLYNPFTQDHLEIPKNFEFQNQVVVYGFGFNPTTNDYKIVKISYYTNSYYDKMARQFRGFRCKYNRQLSEVQVYSLRSNVWQNRGDLPYRLDKWSSTGVHVKGRLHWVSLWGKYDNLNHKRKIVSFDLNNDSFDEIENPGYTFGSLGTVASCDLVVLNECLCVGVPEPLSFGEFSFWVMKQYGVNESWVKAYNIGPYFPKSMVGPNMEMYDIWREMARKRKVRILGVIKSGELLLQYRGVCLVSYDLQKKTFKKLAYPGMPKVYETTIHVGSFMSTAFSFF